MKMTPTTRAGRVAVIYLGFGTLWIIATDRLIEWLAADPATLTGLQTLKGAAFVLVTALIFFYLAYRELTHQNQANAAAGEREHTLRSLFDATFDHAAVGMVHTASNGRFIRVNPAYCNLVGYDREELLGMTFQDITHPDDLRADLDQYERMLAGDIESFTMDKRFIAKDGSTVWATLTSSAVPDVEGRGTQSLAVINDISERKAAEEAVRSSEAKYRALVEQSIIGVYIFDEKAFRYVNHHLAGMLGYSESELIDHHGPLDLVAPEDRGVVKTQIRRRLEGKVKRA